MSHRLRGEDCRTTVVCVDSYENDVPKGRFFAPYLPPGRTFHSLMQLLQEIEDALNVMDTPASEHRENPASQVHMCGHLATFAVRILYRQNTSWQGCVTWLEGKEEYRFRSALELLLLMRDVLYQDMSA